MVKKSTAPPSDWVLYLTMVEVRNTLHKLNPWKAAGPYNIPRGELRKFADQLAEVLKDLSEHLSVFVPKCLKATTIQTKPKKLSMSCLSDYCPVTLTPNMMKCFRRLLMKTVLFPTLETTEGPLSSEHQWIMFGDRQVNPIRKWLSREERLLVPLTPASLTRKPSSSHTSMVFILATWNLRI